MTPSTRKLAITLCITLAVALVLFVGLSTLPGNNVPLRVVLGWIAPIVLIGIAILLGIAGRKSEDEITRPPTYTAEFDGGDTALPDDQPKTPEKPKASVVPALVTILVLFGSFFVRVIMKQFEEVEPPTRQRPPAVEPDTGVVPPPAPDTAEPTEPDLPAFGDYFYVDALPVATKKVAPMYPEAAREAQVQGTVMVHALINREGRAVQTRVTQSIPLLDDAAVAAVMQWEFKPAMVYGEPVAIWVAVPVKFTLH